MNIVNVLNLLGYEVLRHNHDRQVYLVKKIPLRAKREGLKHNREFKLKLKEVGFDDEGDFYVTFMDPTSKAELDEYWHNNMKKNQIYDIDFDIEETESDEDFEPTPAPRADSEGQQWLVSDSSMFRFL